MKALITQKIGMTSTIGEDGSVAAITLLSAGKNTVTQIKNMDNDGYKAVQLGYGETKSNGKTMAGHLKPSKSSVKVLREITINDDSEHSVGDQIGADIFNVGDKVHVTGTSKGKGWAGAIKRHNFHRQRKTHGGKGNTREVGSIGSMYPQKIFKGKKMAGQLGNEQVTVRNLKIALINAEENIIGIYGAIPGPNRSLVIVKEAA